MRSNAPPKKLLDVLRKKENRRYLVLSHIHLEGDALGSELAMARLLRRLGKKAVVVNEDEPVPEYLFLPDIRRVRHSLLPLDYDVAVFVDCSDVSRVGKAAKILKENKPIINIDHHISNTRFGDINWVQPKASCACEMVYELFKALGVSITKQDAILLYTGIMVDTGSFKYASTSAETHRVAADLLSHGLDVYGVHRQVHESLDLETIKAFGQIIATLKTDRKGKVAWLSIPHVLIRKIPALAQETDHVLSFARSIKGVEVALLFKETQPGKEVRVNLRSRGQADVNKIASVFGGGGHAMASGCTLKTTLKGAIRSVVDETKERLT
ncbi:MAG: bifunctional oligoribonuclease/PAP phosphatase NrnA [Candidatus Omnitrophota bacterium]